ncbi:hypothetical protein BpHYR1_049413 [Brachionus plicatilis]|uniref:Uncharacterized protein n=1 Tax=Brachionus plicatilis TaxID=10195 RepID=A0A3M7Q3V9_BRAPC|nr:hypothetical protein BpHYR1_049413 [Brachionus plicatilis]
MDKLRKGFRPIIVKIKDNQLNSLKSKDFEKDVVVKTVCFRLFSPLMLRFQDLCLGFRTKI